MSNASVGINGVGASSSSVAGNGQPDNAAVATAREVVGHPGHRVAPLVIRSEGTTRRVSGKDVPVRTQQECDDLRALWRSDPVRAQQIEASWYYHDFVRSEEAERARKRFAGVAHCHTGNVGIVIGL